MKAPVFDIAIIGEGVNGCRIARNAADRNLSVYQCKLNEFVSRTSSLSTDLNCSNHRYHSFCKFHPVQEPLTTRDFTLSSSSQLSIHNSKITTDQKLDECRNIKKTEYSGHSSGGPCYTFEVSYLIRFTLTRTANDTLCRRPNHGQVFTTREAEALADWTNNNTSLDKKLSL